MTNEEVARNIVDRFVIASEWNGDKHVGVHLRCKKRHDGPSGAIAERDEIYTMILNALESRSPRPNLVSKGGTIPDPPKNRIWNEALGYMGNESE